MFDFPPTTLVNRVIHKTRILGNARPSTRLKDLLTQQIQQIRWHAKLSPETIRIPATPQVPEIQVFHLALKGSEIHPDLLALLDKTIPQPMLWVIETTDHKLAHSAAYKRPGEADASQWVVGPRFTSDFAPKGSHTLQPLPVALDLARLYTALLQPLLPLAARNSESLPALIERCDQYQLRQRKITQLTAKVNRERQFNRRVALNQQLNILKAELDSLTDL
jgi:hypothetical protein